ncbi:uncharacterized protein A1O5_10776 [Cladophialophora psammophila CBS 110553]|uniref:Uncharacterized protein n=1 Tax=Cladophialophora psammophila CBS 110553 TaxID=1182543 RepID=W9WMC7_9EURO|nr:uncharacterized protein A1O5_10776 [Cladophialophora psammophila CBS 110553]EXJ66160.1 hypothetical protein A1O5_10776 [Cladophialophora psammophila CBS 110553]
MDTPTGYRYPPRQVSWLVRDVLLFNISVGATADELHLTYEGSPNFQALPTFPVVLPYKGTSQEVVDFTTLPKPTDLSEIPRIPIFDRQRVVDGEKHIKIFKPLPLTSKGRRFELHQTLLGIYDKGKPGTVIETQTDLLDIESHEIYATVYGSVFAVGQGGWGGSKGPETRKIVMPNDRGPDYVHTQTTTKETPLLYRLNGDYNPLHAHPGPGRRMGFGGSILHGLCTWNMAAHALLSTVAGSKSSSMKEFQARFVAPVRPGQTLYTQLWSTGERDAQGYEEFRFQMVNEEEKVVLANGRAIIRPASRNCQV